MDTGVLGCGRVQRWIQWFGMRTAGMEDSQWAVRSLGTSVLDHHSREFCVQLSGQVANSSARIRIEQATPAMRRDLMTVALG